MKYHHLLSVLLTFIQHLATAMSLSVTERVWPAKTIHMSATVGGISHIGWVLEIGQLLVERGHNVSYITTEPNLKYVTKYPEIHSITMGPDISTVQFRDLFDVENPFSSSVRQAYIQAIRDTMARDYKIYREIFLSSNPALVFCDHMAVACMDAAHMLDIPVIVTTTMSMSEDTRAPFIRPSFNFDTATTLDKSLWERFVERYFTLPRFILRQRPVLVALNEIRRQLGIKPWEPLGRHAGTIKFINAFWGVESPRPVGPFVEYVGPVMNRHYDPLTPALAQFLDRHSRVVYIAFGQMYAPNTREFGTLLTGLLEAYEEGILDGLVWSLSRKRSMDLPPTIQTSRKTYNTSNLLNGVHKDMRFEPWSPQFAVLNHCSCKLFVSHGGASSIHESLYNGVPMLLHPFTSDQPVNSEQLAKAGVGLVIDRRTSSPEDIVRKIRSMVLDEAGDYAVNIKTMQALVQIRSRRRHYAADIVEEVLYSVRGKKNIWHRKEDVWHMRWWKATNWDVDGLAFFLMILSVAFVYRTLLPMQRHFVNNYLVSKVKQKAV